MKLTEREIELINGMIEFQETHVGCDKFLSRILGEKEKSWDLERIELLKKIRDEARGSK